MSDALTLLILRQIAGLGAKPLAKKLGALVLGEPLERALRKPTAYALRTAVTTVLGENSTEEQRKRAIQILQSFWTADDVHIGDIPSAGTITEALYNIVAAGIARATAPVTELPGYETTSSLSALSDELSIAIEPTAFAAASLPRWDCAISLFWISTRMRSSVFPSTSAC